MYVCGMTHSYVSCWCVSYDPSTRHIWMHTVCHPLCVVKCITPHVCDTQCAFICVLLMGHMKHQHDTYECVIRHTSTRHIWMRTVCHTLCAVKCIHMCVVKCIHMCVVWRIRMCVVDDTTHVECITLHVCDTQCAFICVLLLCHITHSHVCRLTHSQVSCRCVWYDTFTVSCWCGSYDPLCVTHPVFYHAFTCVWHDAFACVSFWRFHVCLVDVCHMTHCVSHTLCHITQSHVCGITHSHVCRTHTHTCRCKGSRKPLVRDIYRPWS